MINAEQTFHVFNFGAYPNDDIDDSKEIQLAINTAITSGFNRTVVFGVGTYHLSSTIFITNATNLTLIGQGIGQTVLVGTSKMFLLFAQYCNGLTITSLSIDFDPLPFTAGYVVNVSNIYLDIQI
jgi:hypothetical protein